MILDQKQQTLISKKLKKIETDDMAVKQNKLDSTIWSKERIEDTYKHNKV